MDRNWDDIRFVLAVVDAGSLSGAARALRVNHATVLRRINAYEDACGVTLFTRGARGLTLAPQRRKVIAEMRQMFQAAQAVSRSLIATQTSLTGQVRITATDTFCQVVLPRILVRLSELSEGLSFEVNSTNAHVSLADLDADIAIRPAETLPSDMVGEQAGRLGFAPFAAPGCEDAPWLGLSGPLQNSQAARWHDLLGDRSDKVAWADSFLVLRELVAAGQGRALLPVVVAQNDMRLMRLAVPPERGLPMDMSVPIWVATHKDLASVAHLSQVRDLLVNSLRADADRLTGRS